MEQLGLNLKFLDRHNTSKIHIKYEPIYDFEDDEFMSLYFKNDTFFKSRVKDVSVNFEQEALKEPN